MNQKNTEHGQYVLGFILAVVLTVIPFWIVFTDALSASRTAIVIGICAVVQAIVHVRFFLHVDLSRQKREDLDLILFTLLLLIIFIGGTVWIMTDLHHRMH